jgi:hypothetical protein
MCYATSSFSPAVSGYYHDNLLLLLYVCISCCAGKLYLEGTSGSSEPTENKLRSQRTLEQAEGGYDQLDDEDAMLTDIHAACSFYYLLHLSIDL